MEHWSDEVVASVAESQRDSVQMLEPAIPTLPWGRSRFRGDRNRSGYRPGDAGTLSAGSTAPSAHQGLSNPELDANDGKRASFHRTRDASEADLTVVLIALAVARFVQDATGVSLTKIITSLRPLREFTGRVGGQDISSATEVTGTAREIAAGLMPGLVPGHRGCGTQKTGENKHSEVRQVFLFGDLVTCEPTSTTGKADSQWRRVSSVGSNFMGMKLQADICRFHYK